MKRWTYWMAGGIAVALIAAGSLFCGCEEDPNTGSLSAADDYFNDHPGVYFKTSGFFRTSRHSFAISRGVEISGS